MDFLIELIFELLIEGSMEVSANKKLPKWMRYPLIIFLVLFFIFIYAVIFCTAYLMLKENVYVSVGLFIIGLFLLISGIIKFKKLYLRKEK